MSTDELSKNEVPQKLLEWLLAMGCPPSTVPTKKRFEEICEEEFYIVWREFMENVESKDIIKTKRMQVFHDDLQKCLETRICSEEDEDEEVFVPEELSLSREYSELKEKVADAEVNLNREKENLRQIIDKGLSKSSCLPLFRKRLQDAQRRVWLLQLVAEKQNVAKADLGETKTKAVFLRGSHDVSEIESKLRICVKALSRRSANAVKTSEKSEIELMESVPELMESQTELMESQTELMESQTELMESENPVASMNTEIDYDEGISLLVKCRPDFLFKHLYKMQAALCGAITVANDEITDASDEITDASNEIIDTSYEIGDTSGEITDASNEITDTSDEITDTGNEMQNMTRRLIVPITARTVVLQVKLAYGAMKNRALIRESRKDLIRVIDELSKDQSEECIKLLVTKCELVYADNKNAAIRKLCENFYTIPEISSIDDNHIDVAFEKRNITKNLHASNMTIKSKQDQLKKLIVSVATLKRQTLNEEKSLRSLVSSISQDPDKVLNAPTPHGASLLRQYYEDKCKIYKNKVISFTNFDVSDYFENRKKNKNKVTSSLTFVDSDYFEKRKKNNNKMTSRTKSHNSVYFEKRKKYKNKVIPSSTFVDSDYFEKRKKYKNKVTSSTNFDDSDYSDDSDDDSLSDSSENINCDIEYELQLYKKQFNLENNRQLTLRRGTSIWIFESLHSLLLQLVEKCQSEGFPTSLISPYIKLRNSLLNFERDSARKVDLEEMVGALKKSAMEPEMSFDLTHLNAEQEVHFDKRKKRLNARILGIEKVHNILDDCTELMNMLSQNYIREYISDERYLKGKPYSRHETDYLESFTRKRNVLMKSLTI